MIASELYDSSFPKNFSHQAFQAMLRPAGGGVYLVSSGLADQKTFQRRYYQAIDDADITEKFITQLHHIYTASTFLLGVPSDVGAGFRRGANLGPLAIREAMQEKHTSQKNHLSFLDMGDVFVVPQLLHDSMLNTTSLARHRHALYPDLQEEERLLMPVSPLSMTEAVLDYILQHNAAARPFVLGGDHSVAWPVVAALHRAGKKFAIVQFDAHTDLLNERLGVQLCFGTWSYHANELLGQGGKLIQVGIRASRFPKQHWESTLGVKQFWAHECLQDPLHIAAQIVDAVHASGCDAVYISNDIDGTSSEYADATGTPETDGLSPAMVLDIIGTLKKNFFIVGGDLCEVAPQLAADGGKQTALLASQYLEAAMG